MSTSILNVWITNLGEPCTIANDVDLPHAWVVAVSHCDGRVVNWSEGRYRFHRDERFRHIVNHTPPGGKPGWWYDQIPTRDGHVEIELPPGCYVVRATMHSWFVNGKLFGNWATERSIVQACCGRDVCTTLYAPSAIACSVPLFDFVLPLLVRQQIVGKAEAERAVEALRAVFRPDAASRYERAEFETLRRAFEQMGREIEGTQEPEA